MNMTSVPGHNHNVSSEAPSAEPWGHDLNRPECVLATRGGHVFVSDWRGGVTWIQPDGAQRALLGNNVSLRPNGIALRDNGRFLIAHLDDHAGGVYELAGDGTVRPFLLEVDGANLEPTNFVLAESGVVWITVSTRHVPRHSARCRNVADGYVVRVDDRGARIVADGLAFTNECRIDAAGRWLYVNETYGARISRFALRANGDLGPREAYVQFGPEIFPDGLVFDANGGLWVTSIFSNRLLHVRPDRSVTVELDDSDPAFVARTVDDVARGALAATAAVVEVPWRRYGNLSSAAFGNPNANILYLGCLLDRCVYRMPVAQRGLASFHSNIRPESGAGWSQIPKNRTEQGSGVLGRTN